MDPAVDVTALARAIVDALQAAAPWALVAAGIVVAARALSRPGRTELRLALRGLIGGRPSRRHQLTAGLAIPLLAVASLTISFALEDELRNGPNRMVDRLAGTNDQASWLLQKNTNHFMNDSRLPGRLAEDVRQARLLLVALAGAPGVVTVWSELSDVVEATGGRSTALILAKTAGSADTGVPVAVRPGAHCRLVRGQCSPGRGQAIVDADLAAPGERVRVRDRWLTVVANFDEPASLLNRSVILAHASAFDRPGGSRERPYAIITPSDAARRTVEAIVARRPERTAVELRRTADIQAANKEFWAGNGTPIMLILILLILSFGTIAYFAARRASQEQARSAIATLVALGVAPRTLAGTELARALLNTTLAGAIGFPLAEGVVALANSQILGFHASATPQMALAAMGSMVVVAVLTTGLLLTRLRSLDVPRAMNA